MPRHTEPPDKELTAAHRKVVNVIQGMGIEVISEYPVGKYYRLDCYLPEYHLGVEVDGPSHWKKRDKNRDGVLWDAYRIPVLRIAEEIVTTVPDELPAVISNILLRYDGDVRERKLHAKRTEERLALWKADD